MPLARLRQTSSTRRRSVSVSLSPSPVVNTSSCPCKKAETVSLSTICVHTTSLLSPASPAISFISKCCTCFTMSRSSMIFTGFLNGMNGLSQNQRQTGNKQQRIRQIEERFLRHARSQLFPQPYRRKQRHNAQQDKPHIRRTDQSGA